MRNVIHLGGRLLIICLVSGLLLGLVYNITLPYKEAAEAQALQESLESVCAGGAFTELDIASLAEEPGMEDVLHLYGYTRGEETGHVAVVQSMGYKGEVPVTVALSSAGEVIGIAIGSHEETPGIGDRIETEEFTGQFLGMVPPVTGSAQTISGATYSSSAVIAAVDLAYQAATLVKGA